jgi:hypothetical protein
VWVEHHDQQHGRLDLLDELDDHDDDEHDDLLGDHDHDDQHHVLFGRRRCGGVELVELVERRRRRRRRLTPPVHRGGPRRPLRCATLDQRRFRGVALPEPRRARARPREPQKAPG